MKAKEKYVSFQDWRSVESFEEPSSYRDNVHLLRLKSAAYVASDSFNRALEFGSDLIKRLTGSIRSFHPGNIHSEDKGGRKKILDPQGSFLQKWNKIFVLASIFAISLDPLFFYIPIVNDINKCLKLDRRLAIVASVLRSVTDVFYLMHIIFQFRTGFVAPSSRVFGRGVLVEDLWEIAKRYLSSHFTIDILAVLPLPQIVVFIIIPKLVRAQSLHAKDMLKMVVIFQYIPRVLRIVPLYREVTRTSGILTKTAWAGAAFNLFLYMLASHVCGAFWYVFSIDRQASCWLRACRKTSSCINPSFYCTTEGNGLSDILNNQCPVKNANATLFDFGLFLNALQSGVVESGDFPQKFLYCFWWGLQNLSSLGQNLRTSTYFWENCFAVVVSISGLVLFSLLIGNMQTFLQSTTKRLEEMRVKKRDAEQWMSHRLLPDSLKDRIRRYEQYKWQETRGVDEDSVIQSLPKDIRRDIKRHLCLSLLKRVPLFEKMDDQLLDAMCDRLKPALYTDDSYIVREGDPVDEMLFIMRGKLFTMTTNGGRTGFLNSDYLKAGDFCGEELLTWALDPNLSTNLPTSTRTVQSLSEIEAFALKADDLKFVASQFRRMHSKQLRHTFRFYSQQWRTWAACFIQAAWRRYCRKKLDDSLHEEEERLHNALANIGGSSPSLGATLYASRFAAKALKPVRQNESRKTRMPERISPILLQKPAEPDFSAEENK